MIEPDLLIDAVLGARDEWDDPEMTWIEVSPEVFFRRYPTDDITITVVRGSAGLLLVDTGGSPTEAARIDTDLKQLGELTHVVNTHAHYDHTFGNSYFAHTQRATPIYGHHRVPAHLNEHESPRLAAWRSNRGTEPPRDWDDAVVTAPTHLISERSCIDLGARTVDLIPLAPGHTDGDLVIRVPGQSAGDGDTWIVGDILEEPGPPMYGSGCFPLRWPHTLATLLDEIGDADVLVPGHGQPISRTFGLAQLATLNETATLIHRHHQAGHDVQQALSGPDEWPYPPEALRLAVARGYDELEDVGRGLLGGEADEDPPRPQPRRDPMR